MVVVVVDVVDVVVDVVVVDVVVVDVVVDVVEVDVVVVGSVVVDVDVVEVDVVVVGVVGASGVQAAPTRSAPTAAQLPNAPRIVLIRIYIPLKDVLAPNGSDPITVTRSSTRVGEKIKSSRETISSVAQEFWLQEQAAGPT